jgi:L-ascorbate metabolism protein UlaG (beta-lactamase superfamily)
VREGVRVTWVGHATLLVQLDGVNVLTDPIWSERGTPLPGLGPRRVRPAALRFADLPPLHAVVVSHDHYDHMDLPTLRRLAARHRMPVLAGLNNAGYLAWVGVPGGVDLDWWQCVEIGAVTICSVPAQHDSQRGIGDRSQSLWMGFWISGPSGSVFFAGDTGWGPHFAEIRRRLGPPCIALLPIGAFQPRWFMRPLHVSPDDAARAYRVLDAVHGVPMHYATFQLGDDEIDEPPRELARAVRRRRVTGFEPVPFGRGTDFTCPRTVPASDAPPRR